MNVEPMTISHSHDNFVRESNNYAYQQLGIDNEVDGGANLHQLQTSR